MLDLKGKRLLILGSTLWSQRDAVLGHIGGGENIEWEQIPNVYGSLRNPITTDTFVKMARMPHDRARKTAALIDKYKSKRYDLILFWSTSSYGKAFIDFLRRNNPGVRIYLFMWDTLKEVFPRYRDYFPMFDRVYSFDKDDARRHGFIYLPSPVFDLHPEEREVRYDIAFVGSVHKHITRNRPSTLRFVHDFCRQHGFSCSLHLVHEGYSDKHPTVLKKAWRHVVDGRYLRDIETHRPYGFIRDTPLPFMQMDRLYSQAKVVLDINHPGRQGLTYNCLMALGKEKKLITTNARIKEEPFYDPNVIHVIDERHPSIDPDFINSPYVSADVDCLRIDRWLQRVLEL